MGSCSRRGEDGNPEYPGFYKFVDVSVLQEGKLLSIPQDFLKTFEVKVPPRQCQLETVSGSWLVGVKRVSEEYFFKNSWREFVAGNSLKLGETIVFEYTGHAKFFVEIYGKNRCSKSAKQALETGRLVDDESDDHDVIFVDSGSDSEMSPTSESSLVSETECRREPVLRKKPSRRGRVRKLATVSPSGNPCFSIKMFQTHLTKGPLLTPRNFLRYIYKPRKAELLVGNMSWKVTWTHPYPKSSRFSGGWPRFAKQNGLKEGDFCDFELISKSFEIAVMKVSIRRM